MKQPELFADEDQGPLWVVYRGAIYRFGIFVDCVPTPEDMAVKRATLVMNEQPHVFLRAPNRQTAMNEGAKRLIQLEREEKG